MPIYPGSTLSLNLYPTSPAEINISLFPPPESGGITLVQSASGTTADGSAGLTVSFGVPCTAGNSVVALISCAAEELNAPPTIVGGGAEDVTSFLSAYFPPSAVFMAVCHDVESGGTGVTYSLSNPERASMTILEVSGLADAAAEDTSANSGGSDTYTFNEVTPISASNLIIGIGAHDNGNSEYSSGPTAPFTRLGTGVGGANVYQDVVYAIQETATAQSTNMNITLLDSFNWATAAAVFGGS